MLWEQEYILPLAAVPGSLTYNKDMFLDIPLIADWHAITQRQEHVINENLTRENQKQRHYDYVPHQRILTKKWNPHKLSKQTSGPYQILQTHVNGALTIELRPGVSERIHIRRDILYRELAVPYSHVPLETKPNVSELHNYKCANWD